MSQINLLIGGAVLITFGLRVLTMPLEEISSEEIELELDDNNSSFANSSMSDPDETLNTPVKLDCHLQKNESGVITTVNMTREEAGNDTFIGYEDNLIDIRFGISIGALGSLAGK